ncbi:hypothetical protein [Allobranchiibius sp. GilTou73]|uniref:hypothetical protein n=1 Tax=Allobranchiibius sp. GilTou73 TaxID=2904523 RepID=UPI001F2321D8|nr:hypothetical protein [Allobranchiibius sp. GilTou73]UIJ33879.1 hypothetical protein LVQ62_12105 [Allobranchiibius sp. GilTou73]
MKVMVLRVMWNSTSLAVTVFVGPAAAGALDDDEPDDEVAGEEELDDELGAALDDELVEEALAAELDEVPELPPQAASAMARPTPAIATAGKRTRDWDM